MRDMPWPGVDPKVDPRYRQGHHDGWNAALAARSEPPHLDAYMTHPEGYREGWAAAMKLVRERSEAGAEPVSPEDIDDAQFGAPRAETEPEGETG